jgi:hypothetical protein
LPPISIGTMAGAVSALGLVAVACMPLSRLRNKAACPMM